MSSELRQLWEHAGGQLPDDWRIEPLESLLRDSKSIAVGVMYPGPDTPGGTPLLKVGDIKDGRAIRPSYCISAATDEEHRRTKLVGDELLITLVGNPGECVVVTPEMAGWNPARAIAVIRLRDTSLCTYLKTVLESTAGRHLIDAVLNTTVQKTLNLKDLRKLPIPLPPSTEIKSISGVSEALSDRISLLRETNTTLEAIAQALFKSWFVDFDPVRAKQQGIAPQGMDAATAALFPDSFEGSELGEVPRGWRVGSIGDIASVKGGFAYKSTEFCDAGFPVVKIKNIVGDGTVDLLDTQFIGSEIADKTNRFALKDGDVVMAMTGATIGKSGVVVTTGNQVPYLNQRVAKFEPSKQGHDNRWLVFVAFQNSVMSDQVVNAASGSAQPNISTSGIESVRLTIPSRIELLAVFSDYADTIFQSWMANQKQAQTLATLRDTLLPRLISGQLRLPEAQSLSEEMSHV